MPFQIAFWVLFLLTIIFGVRAKVPVWVYTLLGAIALAGWKLFGPAVHQ